MDVTSRRFDIGIVLSNGLENQLDIVLAHGVKAAILSFYLI